jgi:glucose-1-phosphate thymidylyltransferase
MKGLVLAAGYATRLYPLTLDKPKPLLEVGGRAILARLLEQLVEIDELDTVYVVTNSKFARHFETFVRDLDHMPFALRVVDDGTTSDETKLGAIGDLDLVVRQEGIDDDLLVAAGDSIFGETRLADFARFCLEKNAPAEAVYDVGDLGGETRGPADDARRDRALLLPAPRAPARPAVCRRGEQRRPARAPRPVVVHA